MRTLILLPLLLLVSRGEELQLFAKPKPEVCLGCAEVFEFLNKVIPNVEHVSKGEFKRHTDFVCKTLKKKGEHKYTDVCNFVKKNQAYVLRHLKQVGKIDDKETCHTFLRCIFDETTTQHTITDSPRPNTEPGHTSRGPWKPTTGGPWRPTTGGPWRPTTGGPWKPTTGGPWRPTTGGPWRPTTGGPWSTTRRHPLSSTGRPWTRGPRSSTRGHWTRRTRGPITRSPRRTTHRRSWTTDRPHHSGAPWGSTSRGHHTGAPWRTSHRVETSSLRPPRRSSAVPSRGWSNPTRNPWNTTPVRPSSGAPAGSTGRPGGRSRAPHPTRRHFPASTRSPRLQNSSPAPGVSTEKFSTSRPNASTPSSFIAKILGF